MSISRRLAADAVGFGDFGLGQALLFGFVVAFSLGTRGPGTKLRLLRRGAAYVAGLSSLAALLISCGIDLILDPAALAIPNIGILTAQFDTDRALTFVDVAAPSNHSTRPAKRKAR